MLAGAVALAAGRFQPLVRLQRVPLQGPAHRGDSERRSVLATCWRSCAGVALRAERRVACRLGDSLDYDQLGDDCDFLTIAGDWPYRYSYEVGDEPIRGIYALDDLIGRRFESAARRRLAEARRGGGGPIPAGCWAIRPRASPARWGRCSCSPARAVVEHLSRREALVRLSP